MWTGDNYKHSYDNRLYSIKPRKIDFMIIIDLQVINKKYVTNPNKLENL